MAQSNITIRDVAKAAGVSVSTVSRVLNEKDDVAPETVARVRHVIDELGYMSSLAARSMRSRKTYVIGLLIVDLGASFSLEVIRGVGKAIQELDYDLIIYGSGRTSADAEPGWERKHVARLNGSITDGLIVVTPTTVKLPNSHPLVVIDPCEGDGDFPSVFSDNYTGARAVMDYLLGLGHRRVGFIGGRYGLSSAAERRRGYEKAMTEAGVAIDPALIQEGDYTRPTGCEAAKRLLALSKPPTAIFAANDLAALGVLDAARELGLSVPGDLSVAGFDDVPEAAFSKPGLTTVAQPIHTIASTATTMLVDLIRGKAIACRQLRLPTHLVVRDSCQTPRQT